MPIPNCEYCEQDTAGNHALGCPCNPFIRYVGYDPFNQSNTTAVMTWRITPEQFIILWNGHCQQLGVA